MWRSKCFVIFALLLMAFSASMSISGFGFLTNQYVYYRFLDDANLPYDAGKTFDCKSLSARLPDQLHNLSTEARDQVQAQTARFLALMSFLSLGCSLFAVVVVGLVSDRYGRVPAIAVVLLGQGLNHIIIAFVVLRHWNVMILIGSSLICGIVGGGYIAFIVQVNVCFVDMTKIPEHESTNLVRLQLSRQNQRTELERNRLILLGMFDATVVLAGAVGSAIAGVMIDHLGFVSSVLGLLGVYCLPVVLIWFIPETKQPTSTAEVITPQSQMHDPVDTPPTSAVVQSTSSGLLSVLNLFKTAHPDTLLVFIALFLFSIVILTESQYLFLYLMSEPFCWTSEGVGLYSGVGSLILSLASLGLTLVTALSMKATQTVAGIAQSNSSSVSGSTVALLRADEELSPGHVLVDGPSASNQLSASLDASTSSEKFKLQVLHSRLRMLIYISVGFCMITINKLIMGSASTLKAPHCTVAAIIALGIGLIRAAVVPTMKSYLSSLHSADTQGRLFSLFGMAEYIGLLIGLPSLSAFYATTVAVFPGSVFFLSAALSVVALVMVLLLVYSVAKEMLVLRRILRHTSVTVLGN